MNDKQQLAAMGEHMSEQAAQPMCMAKRIDELEAQLAEKSIKVERLLEINRIAMKRVDGMLGRDLELSRLQSLMSEGWQLVPVEPTKEMREAFHEAHEEWESGDDWQLDCPDHQWRAMLAAAPKTEVK